MTKRGFPLRVTCLIAIAVATVASMVSFWPRDPDVDGRTNIYALQVFVHDKDGGTVADTGVTFLDLTPYETSGGTGTKIVVVPAKSESAVNTDPVTIELVVKVPAGLWGGKGRCDPQAASVSCIAVAGSWKKAVYTETWDPKSGHAAFEGGVSIPPYKGVGYGLGVNFGHAFVSVPQITLPQVSAEFSPDVALRIPGWRSYQWQGVIPENSITSGDEDDVPAFLLAGQDLKGVSVSPGFTSTGINPSQVERDDRNLLITGALLGVLGGVIVALATELLPRRLGGSARQIGESSLLSGS